MLARFRQWWKGLRAGTREGGGQDKIYLIEKPRQSVIGQLVSSCQRKQNNNVFLNYQYTS